MASKEELSVTKQQGSNRLRSKMLSKEAAAQLAVPSFRVYYSVASAGAVPFLWESQPGTPKNDSPSAAALPPLTPPPSYYTSGGGKGAGAGGRSSKKRRGAGTIFSFLRRPGRSTTPTTPCVSTSTSSSSWSSTSSSSSSAMSPVFAVARSSPPADGSRGGLRRTFSAGEDDADAEAPCFGMEPECCERGMVKGCSVVGAVRNALATVVGGKPAAGRRAA
ncbi:hypothetical protein EJB05_33420, partial [Eragrostis curvula]